MTQDRRRSGKKKRTAPPGWSPIPLLLLAGFVLAVLLVWTAARHHWFVPVSPPTPVQLSMAEARAYNATIPFVGGAHPTPARPFHFKGTPAAREQAIQCLATAALYEAGDDDRAQRAVIQVVLNRLALPHYPKTVCGVVYQGSGRSTGCQFSFTCDGSVLRRPEHAGWPQAREAARLALAGHVFAPVGTATHYHTDWMVPYWMPTLDKIAQIRTHIYYRPHHGGPVPMNQIAAHQP